MLLCIGEFGEGRPDFGDGGQPGRQLVKKKEEEGLRGQVLLDRHHRCAGVHERLRPCHRRTRGARDALPSPATRAILIQLKVGDLIDRV